jgi:hypothetical protein
MAKIMVTCFIADYASEGRQYGLAGLPACGFMPAGPCRDAHRAPRNVSIMPVDLAGRKAIVIPGTMLATWPLR